MSQHREMLSPDPVLRAFVLVCLAGGTPRFVAENKEALRSLMQLHPLNLTKPGTSSAASEPPSPNPLLDSNPFGAVPLSALRESPRSATVKRQGNSRDDAGHFGTALAAEGWSESAGPDKQAGPLGPPDSAAAASCQAFVKDQV